MNLKQYIVCTIGLFTIEYGYSQNNGNIYSPGDSVYFQGVLHSSSAYEALKKKYVTRNFETYTMPGLSYSIYQPKAKDSLGTFEGLTVEYLLYAKVHDDDDPGPSNVRVYLKVNILNSNKSNVASVFGYSAGVDLSLEKNPKRAIFIPYFGLESGIISQKAFHSSFQLTPTFGLHIVSTKNVFVNVHAGYIYPFANFEMLQGWFGQAGVDFSFW